MSAFYVILQKVNWNKRTIQVVAYVLRVIGVIGFFSGFVISLGVKYDGELPLGDIQGFVVDDSRNIYIGSGFYSIVQMYDSTGEFVRNWKVKSQEGSFRMDLSEEQNILILTARGDKKLSYNNKGLIIKEEVIPKVYSKSPIYRRMYLSKDGEKYEERGWIFTRIVRLSDSKVIEKQNLLLELLKGPRSFLLIVLSFMIQAKKTLKQNDSNNELS